METYHCIVCGATFERRVQHTFQVRCTACQKVHLRSVKKYHAEKVKALRPQLIYRKKNSNGLYMLLNDPGPYPLSPGPLTTIEVESMCICGTFNAGTIIRDTEGKVYRIENTAQKTNRAGLPSLAQKKVLVNGQHDHAS